MTEKHYAVAIDGPSGAGKSTLARAAAEALHILYVDTGAIYRTIGVYMYRHDIQPTDAAAVTAALPEITVSLRYDEDGLQRLYLNGEDVTKEIRLPAISRYASDVSAIPQVRDYLMELQRSLAREHSVIMDGRDIGTVVLPDADVKIFLCADVETRARRRCLELEQRGTPKPFDEVLREMEQRDYNDTHRAAAPLRPADGAIMIDNTDVDFAASLELLLDVIHTGAGRFPARHRRVPGGSGTQRHRRGQDRHTEPAGRLEPVPVPGGHAGKKPRPRGGQVRRGHDGHPRRGEAGAGVHRHKEAAVPPDAHHHRRALCPGVHRAEGHGGGIHRQRP